MKKLFDVEYDIASISKLHKSFKEQLETKHKPIITNDVVQKLQSKTLFGNDIAEGDFLLLGLMIKDYVPGKTLRYSFFYCTKDELKLFEEKGFYVSNSYNGVPKFIHSKYLVKGE